MRLLNTAKLGLVLITILVALAGAERASADLVPATSSASPATTPAASQPGTQPAPPSGAGAGSQPAASALPDPAATTAATPPAPIDPISPPVATPTAPTDPTTAPAPTGPATVPAPTDSPPSDTTPPLHLTPPSPPGLSTAPTPQEQTPPDDASGLTPPSPAGPGGPPAETAPAPAPAQSSTTIETISQIQISSCTSHCQDASQVQVADQESVTVQVAGTAAQSTAALETQPSPGSSSQVTSSVTQIQIGCITDCFGTTTANPSTAALTQQLLSALTSQQPACGASSPQATPATEESVIDEIACQVQVAQTTATQSQAASQTATTVQVAAPALVSQPPAPQSLTQTQQGTWQLQIGCVFYCVSTQQLQQAQQSITITHVQTGPSGSNTGTVDVADQLIWQVQVGCLAWCYDATQMQVITGQSVVIVDEGPPPVSPPPPAAGSSPPPSSPPTTTPATGAPAPADETAPEPAQSTAATPASPSVEVPPRRINSPTRYVRLLTAIAEAGASVSTVKIPVAPALVRRAAAAVASSRTWGTPTVAVRRSITRAGKSNLRPSRRPSGRPHTDGPIRVADALAATPGAPSHSPLVALLLGVAATLLALAAIWTQTARKPER